MKVLGGFMMTIMVVMMLFAACCGLHEWCTTGDIPLMSRVAVRTRDAMDECVRPLHSKEGACVLYCVVLPAAIFAGGYFLGKRTDGQPPQT